MGVFIWKQDKSLGAFTVLNEGTILKLLPELTNLLQSLQVCISLVGIPVDWKTMGRS